MTDVDQRMTIRAAAQPASPMQLLWLFSRSALVATVFASALYAGIYVARDMRLRQRCPARGDEHQCARGARAARRGHRTLTSCRGSSASRRSCPRCCRTARQRRPSSMRPSRTRRVHGSPKSASPRSAMHPALLPALRSCIREWRAAPDDAAATARIVAPGTAAGGITCGNVTIEARMFFPTAASDAEAVAGTQHFIDALDTACRR